ncbi:MAG: hypothetical protein MMC23_008301 [Stictis urceolatum]|nr:hypothetical protein [Stictis urceolata]
MASAPHLPTFQALTHNIYYHDPSDPPESSDLSTPPSSPLPAKTPNPPALVILLTWGSAPPRALAKYALHYTTLYPNSRILVLTTSFSELFIQRLPQSLQSTVKPAVEVIQSTIELETSSGKGVLLHLFSNGGCFKLLRLSAAYSRITGSPLPISAVIFDSAPGIAQLSRSLRAFTYVLPKQVLLYWLSYALILVYLAIWRTGALLRRVLVGSYRGDFTMRMYEGLNDGKMLGTAPRLYLYSEADRLVDARDVRRHAEGARDVGARVESEEFIGSGHVAHVQVFPERYWGRVVEFWDGAVVDTEKKG